MKMNISTVIETTYQYLNAAFILCDFTIQKALVELQRCRRKMRNNKAIQLSEHLYRVPYVHNDREFEALIQMEPERITSFYKVFEETSYSMTDVTEFVNKLLGPARNFNRMTVTPKDLGFEGSLIFFCIRGEPQKRIFANDETINLSC